MTIKTSRRWPGLLLGLASVLLTGCTMAGARGATINTIGRPTTGTGDCPPAAVAGTAPGLDPAQEANAETVVTVALGRGLGPTGAAIAVAAALAESSLYNYANDGSSTLVGSAEGRQLNDAERAVARQSLGFPHDKVGNNLDSIGLFQQRPMTGWGTPDQLINPATATGKFLDRMITVANWQTSSPWTVAQKVQGSPSSDGGIYRDSYQQATTIVAALNVGSTATITGGSTVVAQIAAADNSCGQPAANAATGPAAWGGYQNGRIPATALCPIPSKPALQLECGAATAFDQLNTAFKTQFGQDIGITDGYRSYDEQVQCRLEKGSLCANPGTSNHGWGKAVDIGGCCGINTGTGPAFDWLTTNAGRYGWNHPAWAQPGGSKPEPWHWEYGAIS
ncbi:D-alanyl-D-alanine carboxypeptidase family protein [Nakamurella sp.]|uniref:D-alanyl-D-alanine carboxypeptidase family protein n=1 Tax=Nakamurella sp. TaxID=1869182 RepID=UPI003782E2C6